MPSRGDHDVEVGKPAHSTAIEMRGTQRGSFTTKTQNSILSKIPKVRPPIPDDLGTMTMACILRNMVVANDVEGATAVIARMNGHRNPEGFTIQDVAGNGILQIAALKNLDSMTKRLLDQGLDINDVDNNHGTAVQAAIYMSHDKVLKVLLDENRTWLDVNTTGGYYGCALQVAAFKGSENYIKQLFRLGVIEDVCIAKSKYGTALQAAARTGLPSILELILRLKLVDVNAESGVYGTALQAAAKGDYTEAPTCLRRISRGRTLKQHTNPIVLRQTAQVRRKYLDVAQILLNRDAKVNAYGGRLRSPVNAAASSGQFEMLKLLLGYDESSPLEEKKAVYGRALLSAITQTFNENRLPLVKELIDRGADVNFAEGNGLFNRPLTAAAAMNDQEVVAYLLEISEDKKEFMDAESGIYGTALRAALSAPKPARNTVLYLIRQGANLSKGDQPYGNILHLATFANLNDIVEVLLDEYKVAVNALDMNDQTALHIAAYRGYEQVANTLLKRGANTDLRDVWGNTPLDVLEDVIGRESHPVPSLEGLRKIRKRLFQESVHEDMQRACRPFPGPLITRQSQDSKRARPVFDSPKWNPGLKFRATIVDFLEKGEQEYILVKDLQIDDLLYKKGALDETMGTMEAGYEVKLRWIHLPANNMTWAEMLMKTVWPKKHKNATCQSIWGSDPYPVSPDLGPHARFVIPQCRKLILESLSDANTSLRLDTKPSDAMFLAMPYIHWESYSRQVEENRLLDDIKEQSLKTRIWRSHDMLSAAKNWIRRPDGVGKPSPQNLGSSEEPSRAIEKKTTDYDAELLDTYLFKPWPLHLRRTLSQYYYSYLADTPKRDCNQVAMRARSRKLRQESTFTAKLVNKETQNSEDVSRPDRNSPVIMVDQLWLWIVSQDLIITSFPQRKSYREEGDLDPEDKTDVLKTLLASLHSTKRSPIQDAYDLCGLIVSQTVGILHRFDMIAELDFLKIFATQADWAIDLVQMEQVEFMKSYKIALNFLNTKGRDLRQYVKLHSGIFSDKSGTELLQDIQYMKEELNMVSAVFRDQKSVLEKVGEVIDKSRKALLEKAGEDIHNNKIASLKSRPSAFNFQQQSEMHAEHIDRMQIQASLAYDNLQDLQNLKQQRSNALDAQVNRNQAIASQEQANAVMVFTIVTIIFLPLTFMATIFTLPVLDFPRFDPGNLESTPSGMLKGSYVFVIIVGFSLAFAILLITIAFNVKHLYRLWGRVKEFKNNIFPLHMRDSVEG